MALHQFIILFDEIYRFDFFISELALRHVPPKPILSLVQFSVKHVTSQYSPAPQSVLSLHSYNSPLHNVDIHFFSDSDQYGFSLGQVSQVVPFHTGVSPVQGVQAVPFQYTASLGQASQVVPFHTGVSFGQIPHVVPLPYGFSLGQSSQALPVQYCVSDAQSSQVPVSELQIGLSLLQ